MRRLFLCLGLVSIAGAPASAQIAPFSPVANAPDYVVTLVEPNSSKTTTHTVIHHGKWARVETAEGADHTTAYFAPDGPIEFGVRRPDASGEVVSLSVTHGRDQDSWHYAPQNTGERHTLIGETCTVWTVLHSPKTVLSALHPDSDSVELSCVTDDGIELWHKLAGGHVESAFVEATHIERRPVAADEVRVPSELLMLNWWQSGGTAPAGNPTIPDYETVMTDAMDPSFAVRVTRRHDRWDYVDETISGKHTLTVTSPTLLLRFSSDAVRASQRLFITKGRPNMLSGIVPEPRKSTEQWLGESCDWYTTVPWPEGGQRQCRTADGLVLKEWHLFGVNFVATRVTRRPLDTNDVTPPAEILDPTSWGLD
ncbi:MAG TPA: hypothetical protein VLX44_09755 [Xanthobacteraceae bacterium]|nr:hypothetical protein [Xanthobacteraceae bacterium]